MNSLIRLFDKFEPWVMSNPWRNWFIGHAIAPVLALGLGLALDAFGAGSPRVTTLIVACVYSWREGEQFADLVFKKKIPVRNALALTDRVMDQVAPWGVCVLTFMFTTPTTL